MYFALAAAAWAAVVVAARPGDADRHHGRAADDDGQDPAGDAAWLSMHEISVPEQHAAFAP